MRRITKTLFLAGGILCVILGLVGIVMPVLPTTPFLLLAVFLFTRSSERALHWLLTNRWFGRYIRNYHEGRGLPLREKIISLSLLWLTIGLTVVYVVDHLWVRLFLLGIATGVTIHLTRINTYRPEVD